MSVKYAVLGILNRKDLHGYRIKQVIERDFGTMWTVNYGQIYPTLQSLRDEGLVTMSEVPQPASPPRKLYSITPAGRRAFVRWLNESPEKRMILRDPFLLRFPFFDLGDAGAALEMVEEQVEFYEGELVARRENLLQRGRGSRYARLVSELGLELNETMLRWLTRARDELRAARPEPDAEADEVVGDGAE